MQSFNVNLASNRMVGHTDAASGVVPIAIVKEATLDYKTCKRHD
ncbi:hypothetical protein [Salipaludibacillus sp. CF4.18]